MPISPGTPQPDKEPEEQRSGDDMASEPDPPLKPPPPPPAYASARDERGDERDGTGEAQESIPLEKMGDRLALDLVLDHVRREHLHIRDRNRERGDPGPPVDRELLARFVREEFIDSDPGLYDDVGRLISEYDAWFEAYRQVIREHRRPRQD